MNNEQIDVKAEKRVKRPRIKIPVYSTTGQNGNGNNKNSNKFNKR